MQQTRNQHLQEATTLPELEDERNAWCLSPGARLPGGRGDCARPLSKQQRGQRNILAASFYYAPTCHEHVPLAKSNQLAEGLRRAQTESESKWADGEIVTTSATQGPFSALHPGRAPT